MSTSCPYHALGLHGDDWVRQSFVVGSILFHARNKPKPLWSPEGDEQQDQDFKHQAYGHQDHQFFKLRIMAIREAKYA